MHEDALTRIIRECLSLDMKASGIYLKLAADAPSEDLKEFWKGMAVEEGNHVAYWRRLLDMAGRGEIPQVIEDPESVIDELEKIHSRIGKLGTFDGGGPDVSKAFVLALRLEFHMMHPAMATLFHYMKTLSDEKTPADDYEGHIDLFFQAMGREGLMSPELELLADVMHKLWSENRKLVYQNTYDFLTGTLNRRSLFNAIKAVSSLSKRNRTSIGVMMVDIDHFKRINDSFGHQFGDQVLRYVASSMKKSLRDSDLLGRYGGEEFLAFLSSVEPDSLSAVAEKMRRNVEKGNREQGNVTVSIGLARGRILSDVEDEIHALIKTADENLYKAKMQGRNRVAL